MVLRIKSSATPVSSANLQGLQAMTTDEIKNYVANILTVSFGANADGTGTGEINITTNNSGTGTSIGTFVDTDLQDAIGTHPSAGAFDTVTFTAKQVTAAAAESITNKVVKYSSGTIKEMTDAELKTELFDYALTAMTAESAYTAGQYKLQATAPSGGTWVSRYTLTDIANGGNTLTYLWQKTAATSSPDTSLKPLKLINTKDVKEMSSAEILQMLPNFRNRIIESGVGTYKIQTSTPVVTGTWVQLGNSATDTREQVNPANYAGNFVGNFTGNYAGGYVGPAPYSGTYSGNFSRNFSGGYVGPATYSGTYTGNFTGNYAGGYVGTAPYSGTYSRGFSGNYVGNYVGTAPYSGTYAGNYARNFSGTYTLYYGGFVGGNFAGNYLGTFTGNYTGNYVGPATYSGTYTGNYTGFFTGNYVGPATYTGNYSGTYAGNFTGNYVGTATYTGNYLGTFTGNFTGNFVGTATYTGNYSGTYSQTFSGNYSGATVQATKDTISTVYLWVRTV
jgi:hypothetical protein